MAENKLQIVIEALNKTDKEFAGLRKNLEGSRTEISKTNSQTQDLTKSMLRLAASFVSIGAAYKAMRAGVNYLGQIETATLGIASAFMLGGKYIDETTGKAMQGADALHAAQRDAADIIRELQYANLQTIATLDELVAAYQVTLPVAMAKGFDRQQVKDFTVAMIQAAGAIGLQMNQLGEETRSLLTGAIDPRTSRIAMVLGLRNEDIRQWQGNANALFDFLMDKLSAYRVAGIEAQNTWAGLWSNTKDIILQTLGGAFEPLFETIKAELSNITQSIVTLNDESKKIEWNPEFKRAIEATKDAVTATIAEMYRMGMLLDKLAAAYLKYRSLVYEVLPGYQKEAEENWNKAQFYLDRYRKSEKAVQDLAMRGTGWKPVTEDIDRQMREAAAKGKKLFRQIVVEVGEGETRQLVRYYQKLGEAKPPYKQYAPPSPVTDKAAKEAAKAAKEAEKAAEWARKEWSKIEIGLDTEEAKRGLDEFGRNLINIDEKVKQLEELAAKLPTAAERKKATRKIGAWAEAEKEESASKQAKEDYEQWLKTQQDAEKYTREQANRLKAIREGEIDEQISELDIAEKLGMAHRNTIDERIRLQEELIDVQQKYLDQLDKEKDPAGWYAQKNAIDNVRQNLAGLYRDLRMTDPLEAAKLSIQELNNEWTDRGRQMYDVAKETAQAMQDAFSDFFFDAVRGKFKNLGDYIDSFLNSVARSLTNVLAQMAAAGIVSGVKGLIPRIGAGYAIAETGLTGYGGAAGGYHSGGAVGKEASFYRVIPSAALTDILPRRHSGGLASDERLVINKVNERYITAEQNAWLTAIAQSAGGRNQPTEVYEPHVYLTVNALDSRSVSQALAQHENQIIGMLQTAYNKRGHRGPLGA